MLGRLIASFALVETGQMAVRLRLAVRDYALAAIAACIGLGFLLAAAFIVTARRFGTMEATLGFGFGFLIVAALIIAYHKVLTNLRERREAKRRSTEMKSIASAAVITALPLVMRSGLGFKGLLIPFVGLAALAVLREQGFMRGGEDGEPLDD